MTLTSDLDGGQLGVADLIITTVRDMGGSIWQQAAAVAAAAQESSLRNLAIGDKDSLGLFQQRPSQGWGTAAEISDPIYAITAFCKGTATAGPGLFFVDPKLSMVRAIQAVQQSADGALYGQWIDLAMTLALEDAVMPNPPVPVTWDPAFYNGGDRPHSQLDFIVIHSVEGPIDQPGLAVSLAAFYFGTSQSHETSAHVIIDSGAIVEMLHPDTIAWQCGNCNSRGYGIEQSGYAAYTRAQWTTSTGLTQLNNVAYWAAKIARAYGIPARWLNDQQLATPGQRGFCTHADVTRVLGGTTHTDPGVCYPRDLLMAAVAAQLSGAPPTQVDPLEELMAMYASRAEFEAMLKSLVQNRVTAVVRAEGISGASNFGPKFKATVHDEVAAVLTEFGISKPPVVGGTK